MDREEGEIPQVKTWFQLHLAPLLPRWVSVLVRLMTEKQVSAENIDLPKQSNAQLLAVGLIDSEILIGI